MSRRRVLVLYEHGYERQPRRTGHVRLLRPLAHPSVQEQIDVVFGTRFDGGRFDAVIVERGWRVGTSMSSVLCLIDAVRRSGSPLVYSIDDDLVGQAGVDTDWITDSHTRIVERLAREAVGIVVPTDALRDRMAHLNQNIAVIPDALDERLLVQRDDLPFGRPRKIIGYLGTGRHDEDLEMIAPALRRACERHEGKVEIQLLRTLTLPSTVEALRGLPVRVVAPPPSEWDYPLYMLWYTSHVRWDLALAPFDLNAHSTCMSDLVALDHAAVGAVGVYTRLPMSERLHDARIGMLVDDGDLDAWTEAVDAALSDDERRRAMRKQARDHLFGERTLAHGARRWPEALDKLL